MKAFKTESKRILELMINSIYTNKEIFLRELISNASDALDKRRFLSLTTKDKIKEDLAIKIEFDEKARTITIEDNGIGMDKSDLENNLGVIASSGSLKFKQEHPEEELSEDEIIGQFGVGFYSAFMVADKVSVLSKKVGLDEAFFWESSGTEGYSIKKSEKSSFGTKIVLHIKKKTKEYDFDKFLNQIEITNLVKKYSNYVRYPILMDVTKTENEETIVETQTLNTMTPLWKRKKKDIKADEYQEFYKNVFMDYEAPLKTIHLNVEGMVSYTALLYIPKKVPYDYYTKEYKSGLQLYSKGVFIMEHASQLLPEHFRFIKGLVDSPDLSLNISREILQEDHQLDSIAKKLEKKIKSELKKMLEKERDVYEEFFESFGKQLKYGVYADFGMHKELLQDLIMFYSSSEKKLVTLDEYISRMKADQDQIYYVSGENIAKVDRLPQTELVKDKGYEILYFTDEIDEFVVQVMQEYKEKKFKSISQGDLNLESEVEKEKLVETETASKDMLEVMKEALAGKVSEVKLTTRLKNHAVVLTSTEGISLEMEKVLQAMPDGQNIKANKVLELNPEHPVFNALVNTYATNKDKLADYAQVLYDQALLIEGFSIEDPVKFSTLISDLLVDANK